MPGDGERYDIVVVGVAGGDAAGADLTAELSALTGLSAAKVSLALLRGELIVHRSLVDGDARRAAIALRRLGADVQIRSIDEGLPDIDAMLGGAGLLLPHAGGTPAPIAPPPEFGGAARARSVDIGARTSASPALVDPSRPQGRLVDAQSERPFAGAFERAAGRARPTPREPISREPGGREPARQEPSDGEPKKVRDSYVGTPRRSKPAESREVAGQIADAQRLAASLEAAAESADAIEVVTLDGQSSESVEVKLGSPAEAAAAAADSGAARVGTARGPDASPRRFAPPDERVALDFGGHGSGARARVEPGATGSGTAMRNDPAASGIGQAGSFVASSGSSFARPTTLRGARPVTGTYGPGVAAKRLFSPDPIANYLFGIAVGLAIGMVIAFVAVRVFSRGDVLALEEELAVSYTKPLQVERGAARPPAAILDDLEAAYGRSRLFFVLTMILAGVPAGLGLGYFKR